MSLDDPGDTCGSIGDFLGLYCPEFETMFLPVDRLIHASHGFSSRYMMLFAHEYSHHVQYITGLLTAAYDRGNEVGWDSEAGQEVGRRIELQANCFAGLFMAAGPAALAHGTTTTQIAWARKGYQQRTTAACDTWSAPAEAVR